MNDVQTSNPLPGPYRTGSYLISDSGPDNFRSAMALEDHPYRASGSHQLSLGGFARVLDQVVDLFRPSEIYIADLREESHCFFDGDPVSWYSDNDFGNVGQDRGWIIADEKARLDLYKGRTTKLFTIEPDPSDDLHQERVVPVGYQNLYVSETRLEAELAPILTDLFRPTRVHYRRITVTDHCAPDVRALSEIQDLRRAVRDNDWVHFHCHGGDGRTTTFLALWDMLTWELSGDPMPSLEEFAARQLQLFPYSLDPSGTTGWKLPLAEERWDVLGRFLEAYRR
jgi:hypothetical protein